MKVGNNPTSNIEQLSEVVPSFSHKIFVHQFFDAGFVSLKFASLLKFNNTIFYFANARPTPGLEVFWGLHSHDVSQTFSDQ